MRQPRLDKRRGAVTLFRANDGELARWEYLGVMFYPPDSPDGAQPALFRLGRDKWVMFMSRHHPHVEDWFVGKWNMETNKFEPETCVALFAECGEPVVKSICVWQMKPIELTSYQP